MFECTQIYRTGGILFINYLHEFRLKLYRFFVHMEGHVARFLSSLVEK